MGRGGQAQGGPCHARVSGGQRRTRDRSWVGLSKIPGEPPGPRPPHSKEPQLLLTGASLAPAVTWDLGGSAQQREGRHGGAGSPSP